MFGIGNLFNSTTTTDTTAAAPDANTDDATKLGLNAIQIEAIRPLLNSITLENRGKTVSEVIKELEPSTVGGKRRKSCKKGSKKGKKTKGRR
jgi:hypothetical protein